MRLFLMVALVASTAAAGAADPPRRTRAESFLGIHFDFHAGADCTEVGKNTTRAMVENIIAQVKPDYLQVDCKGHPGLSSYPTRVGNPAPGFVDDPLRVWREVTAKHGVALYMHYSGVIDNEAVRKHPDWAALPASGKVDPRSRTPTSLFGPYADKLLIPQLKELAGQYGVDGVWCDGECWGAIPDYSPAALAAFQKATGIEDVPRRPTDAHYFEFMQFHREAFRRYLRHWVDEVHRAYPRFQIASNWAFSDHMPEPVSANVDFLSGDYSLQNSVQSAQFSGRCMALQGKPWDLMAWAFSGKHKEPGRSLKSIPQLQREAAVVLAQGGGFQAYFKQKRDGSIYDWQMQLMGAAAKFCRQRQAICHRSQAVPQIALLYSTAAHYRQSPRLFVPASPGVTALKGVLQALVESQQAVDICSEHHLAGRLADYPLVVVPEWDYLEPPFRAGLVAYVEAGGRLLLIGPGAAALFPAELDVTFSGAPEEAAVRFLEHGSWLAGLQAPVAKVTLGRSAKPFGRLHAEDDPRSPWEPAASIRTLGKGKIAAVYCGFGSRYLTARTTVARDFLAALVRELFPRPIVEVTGSQQVEVVVRRQPGKLLVNLVNTAGPHADPQVYVFDQIPAVGPLEIRLRLPERPKAMLWEPGARRASFAWESGEAKVVLPRLEIHEVLVVE